MKPYYEREGITIYHGDCVNFLPVLGRPDIVLTDPPYGMEYVSNHRSEKHDSIKGDSRLPQENLRLFIGMARRCSYVFCRWDNLSEVPRPKSLLAWVKNNWTAGDLKHEHGRQWEAICFYPGPHHEFVKRIPDVIVCARTDNSLHPTQKPVELIHKLLAANVGQTILDPYMGSGTTLIAARQLGRVAIGVERDEKYCERAARRIDLAIEDSLYGQTGMEDILCQASQ